MSAAAMALGRTEAGIELVVPKSEPGIGKVILSPTSPDLIAGVEIKPFSLWPDDRGYFLEVARLGQGMVSEFPGGEQPGLRGAELPGHHQGVPLSQVSDGLLGSRGGFAAGGVGGLAEATRTRLAGRTRSTSGRFGPGRC